MQQAQYVLPIRLLSLLCGLLGSQNPLLLDMLTTLQQRHLLLALGNHLLLLLLLLLGLLLGLGLLRLLGLRCLLWLLGRLRLRLCTLLVSGLLRC